MPKNTDPNHLYVGTIEEGLWTMFSEVLGEVCAGDHDRIFFLGTELIDAEVFEIVGEKKGGDSVIRASYHQLQHIAVVTDTVLSTKQFRGTPVQVWGKEVARRIRATQLMSGSNDFKITLVLNDRDREQLVTNGFIQLGPDRLELPIKVRIEVDMSERSTTKL